MPALASLRRKRPPERFLHRRARNTSTTRKAAPAKLPTTLPTTVPVGVGEPLPLESSEVEVEVGAAVPAPPPPIPPAVPSPEAVASFEGDCEALVVKVDVLNLLEPEVEVDADVEVAVEPELVPHVVDERDESIDDVTLVVPDESWLVKLVVVETEVEEEFVEVRNEIVEFDWPLNVG